MDYHWRLRGDGLVAVLPDNLPGRLVFVFLALMTILMSACADSRGIPPQAAAAPDGERVYGCSDIEVDAIIKQNLRQKTRPSGWDTPVSKLHPHLKFIAAEIANATQGKRLSDKHCKIVSIQTLYTAIWFNRSEHSIHYIVELKTRNTNRVSEICVTRNRYSIDSGFTQQDLERWAKEIREVPSGVIASGPTSTTECFMTRELI